MATSSRYLMEDTLQSLFALVIGEKKVLTGGAAVVKALSAVFSAGLFCKRPYL